MSSGKEEARKIASMRAQAERNVKKRIDDILSEKALKIAEASRGIAFVSSQSLFRQVMLARTRTYIEETKSEIEAYIRAYAKASISALGDKDTGATGRLLNSELFGKTFTDRNSVYVQRFLEDVVSIIIAGRKLKMEQGEIEKIVVAQFKDPYTNGVVNAANGKGTGIPIPAYGRGVYKSAYGNIVRNAQGTVALAWAREEFNKARRDGAVGFIPHRGSDYPCLTCDSHAEKFYPINERDEMPLYHARCCCFVEYIYSLPT